MLEDLRYSLRLAAKQRGATLVAVAAMALGVGGSTAIFSVVDTVAFKPLPFPSLDRMIALRAADLRNRGAWTELSPAEYLAFAARNRTLAQTAAFTYANANLSGNGDPERVQAFRVTPGMFALLGVQPALGRTFREDEQEPGKHRVALLSHKLWARRYQADPLIVGRTVGIDAQQFTVIGVLPDGLEFPPSAELWLPFSWTPAERASFQSQSLLALGRLRDGVTREQAAADLDSIAAALALEQPDTNARRTAWTKPLRQSAGFDHTREFATMMLGGAGILLLIACANVANLQLSQSAARRREIAVRAALGASRWRIVRLLLTESILRSLLAGAAGVLVAVWGADLIRNMMPADFSNLISGWKNLGVDARALAFALAVALFTGLAAGIAPARAAARTDAQEALRAAGRGFAGSRGSRRLTNAFVVAQIAASLVLATSAGLLFKGMLALSSEESRREPEKILRFRVSLPEAKYGEKAAVTTFYEGLLERVSALPGVQRAGVILNAPFSSSSESGSFQIEGAAPVARGDSPRMQLQAASEGYFGTLRVPLLAGRGFLAADGAAAPRVAVISDSLARRYFGGQDPVGRRIQFGARPVDQPWTTIVGVVADVRHSAFDKIPRPTIYRPLAQLAVRDMDVLVRSADPPAALIAAIRTQIQALDAFQPIFEVMSLEQLIQRDSTGSRILSTTMGSLCAAALLLALVGVYAVMSYSVTARIQEFGVRLAIGATRGDLLRHVMGGAVGLITLSLAVGLALSFAAARVLSNLFTAVPAGDTAIFAGAPLLLGLAAVLASFIPALRATRVDPMEALRYE
ncbi:MAG: ABC transporter permease [Bryobacteraceae bacterium]